MIWNRGGSRSGAEVPGVGTVQSWAEVSAIHADLVSFRSTFVFEADGTTLTSDSTLRFRRREEVADSLRSAGFDLDDLWGAPDRPGRELVFIARRPAESPSGNGRLARDSRSRQTANPVYGSGLVGRQGDSWLLGLDKPVICAC
jgi:hypothetical protein